MSAAALVEISVACDALLGQPLGLAYHYAWKAWR